MRFKSFKIANLKEKLGRNTAEANDTLATQIAGLEEQVNGKTKELEEAEQQLKDLSNIVQVSEEGEDTPPKPHGPLSELSVEPEDTTADEEVDVSTILEGTDEEVDEEVPVVEVIKAEDVATTEDATEVEATATATAEAEAEAEKEVPEEENDDSLTSLFSQEEEDVNPLAALINSLPDVTPQELLDDLQELNEIIREGQHK